MCCCSSGMINLKELSLVSGKAAWMAYLVMVFYYLHHHLYPYEFRKSSFWCLLHVLLDKLWIIMVMVSLLDDKERLKVTSCRTYTVWMPMVLSLMLLYYQLLLPSLIVRFAFFLSFGIVWAYSNASNRPNSNSLSIYTVSFPFLTFW